MDETVIFVLSGQRIERYREPVSEVAPVAAERWIAVNAGGASGADASPLCAIALSPEEEIDRFASYLSRIPLIALSFPAFSDGRAFSQARIIRERYAYDGDLRATGEVLLDQIPFMVRCGFTSFAVSHTPSINALDAGDFTPMSIYMQPAASRGESSPNRRPWLRLHPADRAGDKTGNGT